MPCVGRLRSSSSGQPGSESPLMLKAVSVASTRSSSQRHKDSARATSTSPMLGLALAALLMLSACSAFGDEPVSVTHSECARRRQRRFRRMSDRPRRQPNGRSNDLKKGRLTRSLKAGNVAVTVKYSLRNRVQRWSPGVAQPLTVSVTAIRRQGTSQATGQATDLAQQQKIYLSRGHRLPRCLRPLGPPRVP